MAFDSDEDKEAEINKLTERHRDVQNKIQGIKDRIRSSDSCCICYDKITLKTITSCCSNAFCLVCLRKWLSSHNTCPLCKHTMDKDDLTVVEEGVDAPHRPRTSSTRRTTSSRTYASSSPRPSSPGPRC